MATILIVSGSYFPYATANAVCAKKFEDVLKRNGHEVLYCNRKHDLYESDHHIYENTELYTVGKNSDLFFQTMQRLQELSLPNKMGACLKIAYKLFRAMMKIVNFGRNSLQMRQTASDVYIKAYASKICSIVKERNVDMMISVSMPFDSHLAVLEARKLLKNNKELFPYWMAYSIDAYWSKAGVNTSQIPDMKAKEHSVFNECDKVLFLDTIVKDYSSSVYDCYRNKMVSLPLPMFDLQKVPIYNEGIDKQEHVQSWLFAGTIYDDFRNVENYVSILQSFAGKPVVFHFMGKIYPKSLSKLLLVQKNMPNQIIIHGRKQYEYAKGSMQRADILVNLANDDKNQIPSKIFEYMSCLKPIVNVYRLKDDVGTEYLKKYPLAYNFNTEDFEDQLKGLFEWSRKVIDMSVTIEDLRRIYSDVLSETVTKEFYSIVAPHLCN